MLSPLRGSLGPLGVNMGAAPLSSFDDYAATLGLTLYYKFTESSGALVNYGSLGSAGNATVNGTGVTRGVTGALGANHAYTLDSTDTNLETPWNTAWATPTTYALFMLFKYNSDGQIADNQRVFGRNVGPFGFRRASITDLSFRVKDSTNTQFIAATTASYVPNNTVHLLFCEYDDAGDRKPRMYVNGTEVTYSQQDTLTGTLQTFSSPNTFTWFNNQNFNVGVNVTVSAVGYLAGSLFTPTIRQGLALRAGL